MRVQSDERDQNIFITNGLLKRIRLLTVIMINNLCDITPRKKKAIRDK